MESFLGFGKERELLQKLTRLIKNPSKFFEKNKEKEESLLDFMVFIFRLSVIVGLIIDVAFGKKASFIEIVLVFLLARLFAIISLWIGSLILSFFVKIFSGKDDRLAAKRIVAYTSITSLIEEIPHIGLIQLIIVIILETIGVSKQYKLSEVRSFVISVTPVIIGILIGLAISRYLMGQGILDSLKTIIL